MAGRSAAEIRDGAKPASEAVSPTKGREEANTTPSFAQWAANQHLNVDRVRADAARFIATRWGFDGYYDHARVLRSLEREKSEHLVGAQLLAGDYASVYQIAPTRQVDLFGQTSPLVPVDVEQCTFIKRNGRQCGTTATPGTSKCGNHGGAWITEAERELIVEEISSRLLAATDRAVAALIDLVDHARSEMVRKDAALAILDRAGLGATTKVELEVTQSAEAAADEVQQRLVALRTRAIEMVNAEAGRLEMENASEDVVDAEVVTEDAPT